MILWLWPPLHPLSKLLAIQEDAPNLEEQLWMEGRREISIVYYRPVTRRKKGLFFCRTISLFLQLVVVISRNGAGEGITNLNPCLWHFGAWAIYLAWENSQGHHCFPRGMTSEQRLQKFRTDDVNSPHLGQGGSSDWPCGERNLLQPIRSTIPRLGNGTSSVWNFSARSSGVISRGITQCRLCFQASTLTIQWNSCKPKRKWKN